MAKLSHTGHESRSGVPTYSIWNAELRSDTTASSVFPLCFVLSIHGKYVQNRTPTAIIIAKVNLEWNILIANTSHPAHSSWIVPSSIIRTSTRMLLQDSDTLSQFELAPNHWQPSKQEWQSMVEQEWRPTKTNTQATTNNAKKCYSCQLPVARLHFNQMYSFFLNY